MWWLIALAEDARAQDCLVAQKFTHDGDHRVILSSDSGPWPPSDAPVLPRGVQIWAEAGTVYLAYPDVQPCTELEPGGGHVSISVSWARGGQVSGGQPIAELEKALVGGLSRGNVSARTRSGGPADYAIAVSNEQLDCHSVKQPDYYTGPAITSCQVTASVTLSVNSGGENLVVGQTTFWAEEDATTVSGVAATLAENALIPQVVAWTNAFSELRYEPQIAHVGLLRVGLGWGYADGLRTNQRYDVIGDGDVIARVRATATRPSNPHPNAPGPPYPGYGVFERRRFGVAIPADASLRPATRDRTLILGWEAGGGTTGGVADVYFGAIGELGPGVFWTTVSLGALQTGWIRVSHLFGGDLGVGLQMPGFFIGPFGGLHFVNVDAHDDLVGAYSAGIALGVPLKNRTWLTVRGRAYTTTGTEYFSPVVVVGLMRR